MKKTLTGMILFLLVAGSAQAALLSRLSGQAYYDDVLDITWLADANAGAGSIYDDGPSSTDGQMTWNSAQAWIASLNTANYLGTNDWRLPTVAPLNGSTFNYTVSYNGSTDRGDNQSEQGTAYAGSTASEMAHLFYNTLNNKGYCTPTSVYPSCTIQSGWGLTNASPFSNVQPDYYWSGTEYAPNTSSAWDFRFDYGNQSYGNKTLGFYAWAVRPGDIALVPVPGAVWLFGGALTVLGAVRRRAMTAIG